MSAKSSGQGRGPEGREMEKRHRRVRRRFPGPPEKGLWERGGAGPVRREEESRGRDERAGAGLLLEPGGGKTGALGAL